MAAKITVSFKDSEMELYERLKKSSCSPAVYIKDLLIKHFEELDSPKTNSSSILDSLEI